MVSATDVDSEDLFYSCISQGDNIDCTVNGNEITFSAIANYNGVESVIIKVEDVQGGEDSQTVQITVNPVNDSPILEHLDDQTIPEDQTFTYTLQASDDDDDDLFFLPPVINGSAVGDIDDNDILTITPNPDYNGVIEITITVSDGIDTDSDSFNLEVTPVNDNPILSFINSISCNANFITF